MRPLLDVSHLRHSRVLDSHQSEQSGFSRFLPIVSIKHDNGNRANQSADVLLLDTAFSGGHPFCVVGEEMAMAFLEVGIPMVAGDGHVRNVAFQIVVGVITFLFIQ